MADYRSRRTETVVVINGRFLSQRTTGVQRFAAELVTAVDQELLRSPHPKIGRVLLAIPRGTNCPPLKSISAVPVGRRSGYMWEQIELPMFAARRHALLLNLCNLGPLVYSRQLVVMHDAAMFDSPEIFNWAYRTWIRVAFRILSYRSIGLITVSEFSRRRLAEHLGLSTQQIDMLGEGSEHMDRIEPSDTIVRQHRLNELPFILAVSSPQPNKNFHRLLKAALLLDDLAFRLVIVGGVRQSVFSRLEVPDSEKLIKAGYVSDAELKGLMQAATCFAFPSLYEGFGLPPLEAMASGCAVAVSCAASLPEVCGEAAEYFDPLDVDGIATALRLLLTNPIRREQLQSAGPKRAAEFRWHDAARQMLSLVSKQLG